MPDPSLPPEAARWMRAAQDGDADAYRHLLAASARWLQRYFGRRLPASVVDDAVQDTLLAIHEKRHTFDPERPFGPWLAAIARYKWIDRLRHAAIAPTEPVDETLSVDGHEESVTGNVSLGRLLDGLKPAQAAAIRLVKLQGLTVEEASLRTGQSPSLIKINIHRGLARLAAVARGGDDDA